MTDPAFSTAGGLLIFLLLLMSLLGVFPLDVILPSFPALASEFSVQTADIAWSVSLFAVGVAVSQSLIGPLSDRMGRKRLLLAGLLLAVVGAAGCIAADQYWVFMAFRVLQAAGCGCFVLTQALVQDIYTGHRRNTLRIYLTSASGVFISLSPLIGSALQQFFGWAGSFQAFIGLAAIVVVLSAMLLEEQPNVGSSTSLIRSYVKLLRDSNFFIFATCAALAFACHFAFIVVSPLLFMDRMALSEYVFSTVFLGYGAAYIIGGFIAHALNGKVAPHIQVALGLGLIGCAGVVLLGWFLLGGLSVTGILLPMVICTVGTTITRPAATTCALNLHPELAGAGAALSNTLLFAIGGLASALVAVVEDTLPVGLAVGFIATAMGGGWLLRRLAHEAGVVTSD
ncbi:MFS transporter [Pseudomonas sp. I2]|uniref:MFS transporter n=1 Tax=Pseudomonas sp. I2 TaxID=1338438 RepID=UPI0034D416BB